MGRARFLRKLEEQIGFLRNSCQLYDRGIESEAIRIAQSLRVLFHDTDASTSLLSHNKLKSVTLLTSKLTEMPLGSYTAFVRIELKLSSPTPVRAVPMLEKLFLPITFGDWWNLECVHEFMGRQYTRRQLVLTAANEDGGAHVSEKLKKFYEELASGVCSLAIDGKNLKYSQVAPYDQSQIQSAQNLHLAMIRQFGHEVLAATNHFNWLRRLSA